jgi:hypothetical protein
MSKPLRVVSTPQPDVMLDDLVSEIDILAERALDHIQEHPGRRVTTHDEHADVCRIENVLADLRSAIADRRG